MPVPKRFEELFVLGERSPDSDGSAQLTGSRVAYASAIILDAAWLTIAVSVLTHTTSAATRLPETFAWNANLWGLLVAVASGLGFVLARRTGGVSARLSWLQLLLIAVAAVLPAAWLGRTVVYLVAPSSWWIFPTVEFLVVIAVSLALLALLVLRTGDLLLRNMDRSLAFDRFSRATTVIVIAAIFQGISVRFVGTPGGGLSALWLLMYVVSGLLLLALARELNRPGAVESGLTDTRERIIYSLVAAGMVALAGIILALLVSPDIISFFTHGLGVLWSLFSRLVVIVALPLGLLAQVLIWLFKLLVHPHEPPELLDVNQAAAEWLNEDPTTATQMPVWLAVMARALPAVVLILITAWLFFRLRRALRERGSGADSNDLHESTGSLLKWLRRRRHGEQEETATSGSLSSGVEDSEDVARIRKAFRRFLENAAQVFRPIRAAETARHYYDALVERLSDAMPGDVHGLVSIYETARYGRWASTEDSMLAETASTRFAEWVAARTEEEQDGAAPSSGTSPNKSSLDQAP